MRRKVRKWLKSYPSAGRLVKINFPTFSLFLYEGGGGGGGDEQKSEEMAKKLSLSWQGSEDRLFYLLSFPTWRSEMSRKVNKWLKS